MVEFSQQKKGAKAQMWLVRHGETVGNVKRLIQGHQPGELTENGVFQAKLLGKRLEKERFDGVYCSDLERTVKTCQEIVQGEVKLDARLREKGGGVLEGRPLGTFQQEAKKVEKDVRSYKPEGGESWEDVMMRGRSFLDEVIP